MLVHVEGIAPCAHNPSIQIRFKLHSVMGVQVFALSVRYQALSKNEVQDSRPQIIAKVWQIQLVSHVLGDPLRQLEWKELQIGMVSPVHILECLLVSVAAPCHAPDSKKNCCFSNMTSRDGAPSCPCKAGASSECKTQFLLYIPAINLI